MRTFILRILQLLQPCLDLLWALRLGLISILGLQATYYDGPL